MSGQKKNKIDEIDQNITIYKEQVSQSEGKFVSSYANTRTKADSIGTPLNLTTPPKHQMNSAGYSQNDQQDVIEFVKNLSKLRDALEQKISLLQVEHQRTEALLEKDLQEHKYQLKSAIQSNHKKEKILQQKQKENIDLLKKVSDLSLELSEKEKLFQANRSQNIKLKLQNKTVKTDNKVLMNHIDRLTAEIKSQQNKKPSLQQRQLRVMKSLYQDTLPNIEHREAVRNISLIEQTRTKMIADDITDRNGQLKSLIRKLNEEIQFLNRQKNALLQENRQKHDNLQNQKVLVRLAEEEKKRLTNIIDKMGQKILSLEQVNQTLRDMLGNQNQENIGDASYYRTTRSKVGQFYSKR